MPSDEWISANETTFREPVQGEVTVFRSRLDDSAASINQFYAVLSNEEKGRADRFIRDIHGARFTVARGTLRVVLGRILERDPASLEFDYAKQGKPTLAVDSNSVDLHFNVSHSGDNAVIAITTGHSLGIDIERYRERLELEKLARRYFSSTEVDQLFALPEDLRERSFYRVWSSKEAVMKVTGAGLSLGLNTFDVEVNPDAPPALLRAPELLAPDTHLTFSDLPMGESMSGVLATSGPLHQLNFLDIVPGTLID